MKPINFFLKVEKPKFRSARAEVIAEFVRELNLDRGQGYYKDEKWVTLRPLSPRFIAVKLAHLKLPDLRYLWSRCKSNQNFSQTFFGALKVKNEKTIPSPLPPKP